MKIKKVENNYILRIDRGEEIVDSIKKACIENKIKAGGIIGIGAVDELKIGIYNVPNKEYLSETLKGSYEVTNLTGNISTMNGEIYLHLHITVTDENFNAKGGHLNFAIVGGTCEIIIKEIKDTIERKKDLETGLNIYDF